jgi:hypothetical protein
MIHVRTLSLTALLALLLAACGTTAAPGNDQADEASARSAFLSAVEDAFVADAEDDGVQLTAAAPALEAQSVEPFIAIRRRDMARHVETLTVTVDLEAVPPTATAEVSVVITGVADLYEVYPDASAPVTLVAEKPIDLHGTLTLEAEFVERSWHLIGAEHSAFTQGAYAATIVSWTIDPAPLVPGSDGHVATVVLDEVDTEDEHLVIGRGRHFRPRSVLNDNGDDPDPVADDDSYAGYLRIGDDARPGRHLGFVHALNYSRTTDLTEGDDGFAFPYTDTLLPVVVWVDAQD